MTGVCTGDTKAAGAWYWFESLNKEISVSRPHQVHKNTESCALSQFPRREVVKDPQVP